MDAAGHVSVYWVNNTPRTLLVLVTAELDRFTRTHAHIQCGGGGGEAFRQARPPVSWEYGTCETIPPGMGW